MGRTLSEAILSSKSGGPARAGDIVVCEPDLILGTDGSTPMALDYFEAMGGEAVADATRILLACDHYAPPTSTTTTHDWPRRAILPLMAFLLCWWSCLPCSRQE